MPVVNVGPDRRVALHNAASGNPIANGLGLRGIRKTKANRLVVQKSKTVIVEHAIEVHRAQATRLFIPKSMSAVIADLGSVLAEIGGFECIRAAWDAPLRMTNDFLFQLGQSENGIIVIDGRQSVFAAERQYVPIIAADSLAGQNGFLTVASDS